MLKKNNGNLTESIDVVVKAKKKNQKKIILI